MAPLLDKIKFDSKKVGFCRFKKLGDKYLITNEIGRYAFLTPRLFKKFLEGNFNKKTKKYQELAEKGFIKDSLDIDDLAEKYRQRNCFVFQGPSLHIVVVTLRCNFKCIYCQASSRGIEEQEYDMDIPTARKVVDTVFETPSEIVTIEFQGGEPLVNWPVVKFITEYAREKNEKFKKKLFITLVSNFSLMTEEKWKFLRENNVSLCTSLDGPKELHNKNRPWPGADSYGITTKWIKKITEYQEKHPEVYRLSALLTTSRFSLKYPKQIVDEYIKWGFKGIHLRPLSYLGVSGEKREEVGYSMEEFMEFWRKAMDYIIDLNLRGKFFFERGSAIMLRKILTDQDPNFMDLRSPCGAGIGQILYNYDGKVYTCDEGRMIGDDTFCIGKVGENSYRDMVSHDTVRALCVTSLLDNLVCDNCVYKPYCGVCPVQNYALYGDPFISWANNERCHLYKQTLDYLFKKLENERERKIFGKWMIGKWVKRKRHKLN